MLDEQNAEVLIEHLDRVDYASLQPMVAAFQQTGISVQVKQEPPGSYGSMGGFASLPTVVQVIIGAGAATAGKVLLQEAAKDAYGALKRGFAALWKNLHHVSDRANAERYSMKLSAVWKFRDGSELRLLLDPSSQPHDAEIALGQFVDIVKRKSDSLERDEHLRIWVFNPRLQRLEPLDPDFD